jgi:hypothetical protein
VHGGCSCHQLARAPTLLMASELQVSSSVLVCMMVWSRWQYSKTAGAPYIYCTSFMQMPPAGSTDPPRTTTTTSHTTTNKRSAGDESLMARQRAASGSRLPECGRVLPVPARPGELVVRRDRARVIPHRLPLHGSSASPPSSSSTQQNAAA